MFMEVRLKRHTDAAVQDPHCETEMRLSPGKAAVIARGVGCRWGQCPSLPVAVVMPTASSFPSSLTSGFEKQDFLEVRPSHCVCGSQVQ